MKEITVPDDHTVVLHLIDAEVGFVPMLAQVSTWTAKIYPKHLWEGQDGFDTGPLVNAPIGSGPFKFSRWEKGGLVELEANKDYFRGAPKVDRLVFRQITDVNVARAEFDSGRLQFLNYEYAPPLAEIPALQRDPKVKVVFTPSHFSRDIQLNLKKAPLDKLQVRQAIAHAIDRDAMNKLAFSGLWKPGDQRQRREPGRTDQPRREVPGLRQGEGREAARRGGAAARRGRLALRHVRDQPELPGLQGHDGGAGAAAPPGRHQREARAVRPGDLVPPAGREAVRHLLLLHPLRTRPGRLPRALHDGRRAQQHELLEPRARRSWPRRPRRCSDKEERRKIYHRIQEIIVTDLPYINLFNEQKTTLIRAGWSGFNTEPEAFDKAVTWFGYYTVTPPGR